MTSNTISIRRFAGMALLLLLPAALLAQPSPRTTAAMVFDESAGRAILFGGATPSFVRGDEQFARDYIDETWAWNGKRWIQLFPETSPGGRGGFAFVWDSFADRAILFGGLVSGGVPTGETWEFRDGAWHELDVANHPEARKYPAAAFDRVRNRVILFGGTKTTVTIDPDTQDEIRSDSPLRDTWEFDGTTWVRTGEDGPDVTSAVMVYDGTRDQTLLLGMTADNTTLMYRYTNPGWEALTPAKLPVCLSRAVAVWQEHSGNVLLYGGACNTLVVPGLTWSWDGTDWTALEGSQSAGLLTGHAMTYDVARDETILFGGTEYQLGTEVNYTYRFRNTRWFGAYSFYTPSPRSLFGFTSDPERGALWLYGGVRGSSDLWKYAYGQWYPFAAQDMPGACSYPVTTFDTDRKVMVLVCADASTYEFDGAKFKSFTLDKKPRTSIQASLAYDPTLKKTVLYGGYDGNYSNETWTWDGSKWTKVDGKKPHYRGLASMFYDPNAKKIVLYGGIGRTERQGTVVRFGDTWTFNGKDWVESTGAASPPARYGAAVAYNPSDNKVHMFGGVNEQVEIIGEHWTFDGAKWTKVEGGRVPPARQNARLAWDPTFQQFVLFGGYRGYYLSDLWVLEGSSWRPMQSDSERRRPVALPVPGAKTAPSWMDRVSPRW